MREALTARAEHHLAVSGAPARIRTDGGVGSPGWTFEDGDAVTCRSLVVTTGTFLNGLIHIGDEQHPAGRAGEPPTEHLAESLR